MVDSIPYLVPAQFLKSIFPPITRSKIPAHSIQNSEPEFLNLRIPRIDSKEPIPQYSLVGRYYNPIPTWFLAPIDCLKILSLISSKVAE